LKSASLPRLFRYALLDVGSPLPFAYFPHFPDWESRGPKRPSPLLEKVPRPEALWLLWLMLHTVLP
jgi:hypothetical protein